MHRQSDTSARTGVLDRCVSLLTRFTQHQNVFSVITSVLPGILTVMLFVDLWLGHPHIQRGRIIVWFVIFGILTILPLIFGSRYPRAGGVVLILAQNYWLWVFVSATNHAHTEVNALLQVPMLAIYVGWFYPGLVARLSLLVNMLVVIFAMISRGWSYAHEFSSLNAVAYAAVVSLFCLEIAAYLRRHADRQSQVDPLTGVFNRRGLTNAAASILNAPALGPNAVTVAVIDFDNFKSVNDGGGHAAGDRALRDTAQAWVQGLGGAGVVARIGGDEFALLIHSDKAWATQKMQLISDSAEHSWSWGLAEAKPGCTLDQLLSQADSEMYRAKAAKAKN